MRNFSMKKFGTPIAAGPGWASEKLGLSTVGAPSGVAGLGHALLALGAEVLDPLGPEPGLRLLLGRSCGRRLLAALAAAGLGRLGGLLGGGRLVPCEGCEGCCWGGVSGVEGTWTGGGAGISEQDTSTPPAGMLPHEGAVMVSVWPVGRR